MNSLYILEINPLSDIWLHTDFFHPNSNLLKAASQIKDTNTFFSFKKHLD